MPPTRLTALAVAVLLAAGCSGGSSKAASKDDAEDHAQTSSAAVAKPKVDLVVSRAELVSPHQVLGPLDAKTSDAVVGVVEQLLLITSAGPLAEGKAGRGFADLFTPDAGARAADADRAAMFDEGLPMFGELEPDEARIGLTGLAGSMDPATALVVAEFVWDVGSTEHPDDRVTRTGELSLVLVDGTWRIASYDVTVKRTIDQRTTTTTATSKP